MRLVSIVAGVAMASALGLGISAASAATCVGTGQTFTLTTTPDATCFATATTSSSNISGNPNGANPDPIFGLYGTGLQLVDKSDNSTDGSNPLALTVANGTLGGAWSIGSLMAPAGKMYTDLIIAFKTGGNSSRISTWAAFLLPEGVTSGTWATTGKNALSHVNVYARLVDAPEPPPAPVPVPAAGVLLLGALGGLGALRRRKTA
ncbi:VPLPA-CTERM sorting domain-containing protein [Rubellimicrobium arenae]|uniref:VPLPA-CTERM sorting domain-containing protein n=1 Tax=Rubellimicrobium arenae TaxID=2817372 RepID=UPI001B310FCB|nr:VPLPA-CTERM sorting domain-containing protein [Rubellimicrobium arenae]